MAQPLLSQGLPFSRVTEVSLFDGVVTLKGRRKTVEIPLVMATRAAVIKGTICSQDLYSLLGKRSRWQWWGSSER